LHSKTLIFIDLTLVERTDLDIGRPYYLIMKVEFNNLYTHFIFTTVRRIPLIAEVKRKRIEKYITGITRNNDCRLYAIFANPEHLHFLVSRSPEISESQLANVVSNSSEKFINENHLCQGPFKWQDSCSAFSISKSDVDKVCQYILSQPKHHQKFSFAEEYDRFIRFYQKTITLK
jgi:REP element-mobilizing transposase RayT